MAPGAVDQARHDRLAAGFSRMAVAAALGQPQSFVSRCELGEGWVK
jgi:hypothetical protein